MGKNGSDLVLVQILPGLNERNTNLYGYSFVLREGDAEIHLMNLLVMGLTIPFRGHSVI